jgi:ferric-dicitrate binding protein FerR (iron transport regulator)
MDDEDRIEPERPADEVAALLDVAGRRPHLPEEEVAPIRAAARAAFQRQARRTARRRRLVWAAGGSLAAGLLVTIGLTLRPTAAPEAARPVATVEIMDGDVAILDTEGRPAASQTMLSGAVLRTGESGRAAVRLPGGTSVRIDAGSAVRLDSPRLVSLERGAVYVDSGPGGTPGQEIEIATSLGSVRHVGTQFETRLLPRSGPGDLALRVRVREGTVLVEQAGETHQVHAGGELLLAAGSRPERTGISVHGPGWDWIQRTAPPIEIEGARLVDFLDWVSREAGLPWRLVGPRAGSRPDDVILHGSIEGLTAEEALGVVLPSSGYRHRRVGDEIVIERAGGP